jgi:phytoene synthase
MTPQEYCEAKAVRSGSALYYSLLFLPRERRAAIVALHALRREVDGVVREIREPAVAQAKLGWWREEVSRIYHGRAQHPVALALAGVTGTYGLDEAQLLDVVEAAQMDLQYNAYPDFDALKAYCRLAAGTLSRLSARVCGSTDERTLEFAGDLGIAFALTRVIRDVGEDARRDRIYVPLHELARFGITSDDLAQARETGDFARLMTFEVQRAEACYENAFAKLPAVDRKAQRPLLAMAAIDRTLLREIRAGGYHVLTQRTSLTPLRKLWIAWRAWLKG